MNAKRFNDIVERRLELTKEILTTKGEEYANGKDRLHNFKIAARRSGKTPAQTLAGMLLKHEVNLEDMIEGRCSFDADRIDEKLGDVIAYNCILEAVLLEEISDRTING